MRKQAPILDGTFSSRLVRMFRTLCDTNRLELLGRLACCGTTQRVGEVASCCPVDLSVVSRHLAAMREAGILTAERKGKEVHYSVNSKGLAEMLRKFADVIEGCCPVKKTEKRRKT